MNFFHVLRSLPLLLLSLLPTTPGRASDVPCGPGFGAERFLGPETGAGKAPGFVDPVVSVWGGDTMELIVGQGADPAMLRVHYPQGSANPGNRETPRGGAGFRVPVSPPVAGGAICLRYQLRFPDGFSFVKGGKLPGLYGGTAPTGCIPPALRTGFSARLMWRAEGDGELYLYATGSDTRCGASLGRGAFRFVPGRWITVAEEVRPDPVQGQVRVWIDGALVVEERGLALSGGQDSGLGLLFSTFFGGDDRSWASPRDQYADFRSFSIWLAPR